MMEPPITTTDAYVVSGPAWERCVGLLPVSAQSAVCGLLRACPAVSASFVQPQQPMSLMRVSMVGLSCVTLQPIEMEHRLDVVTSVSDRTHDVGMMRAVDVKLLRDGACVQQQQWSYVARAPRNRIAVEALAGHPQPVLPVPDAAVCAEAVVEALQMHRSPYGNDDAARMAGLPSRLVHPLALTVMLLRMASTMSHRFHVQLGDAAYAEDDVFVSADRMRLCTRNGERTIAAITTTT
jgi:hypothetical protein